MTSHLPQRHRGRTETSVPMGTREEVNCEIVEAAVFQHRGNE